MIHDKFYNTLHEKDAVVFSYDNELEKGTIIEFYYKKMVSLGKTGKVHEPFFEMVDSYALQLPTNVEYFAVIADYKVCDTDHYGKDIKGTEHWNNIWQLPVKRLLKI